MQGNENKKSITNMKLVYVYDSLAKYGGLERITVDKMNYLTEKMGYDVYIITASQGNHIIKFPLSDKVTHIDLNLRMHDVYRYRMPLRLWKMFQKNKLFKKKFQETIDNISPDIISCTTAFMPKEICSVKTKAKIILESHSAKTFTFYGDNNVNNILKRWYKKMVTERALNIAEKRCDALVTLTHGDAQNWKNAKRKTVIPNFTNIKPVEGLNEDGNCVIAAGRLTEQKGFKYLIDAWAKVARCYPSWRLNIYGDGPYKEILQRTIVNLGLNEYVIMHKAEKDFSSILARNSFFVLSSIYEGFGLVLIEAMECGLPCVSFDCPYGPDDIIKDKEDGLLVDYMDVEALADAICWMIEHEEERKAMGCKAKENVKRFSPDAVMSQWDKLFNELTKSEL